MKSRARQQQLLSPTSSEEFLDFDDPSTDDCGSAKRRRRRSTELRLGVNTSSSEQELEHNSGKMKFPTYEELQLLPEEIRATLLSLVVDFMNRMLYPRLVLLARRRQRRNAVFAAQQQVPTVPLSFIQQVPFFSRWTNLDKLIRSMDLQLYERDEMIVQQGDPTQSGIIFVVQGTISVRKKKPLDPSAPPPKPKGCNDQTTTQVRLLEPYSCYGEKIFLTDEPRIESLRSVTRCTIWVLKRETFFRYFNDLPDDKRRVIVESAYERRRELMPKVLPLTAKVLSEQPLFCSTPLEYLEALATKADPRVYPKKSNICKIGDSSREMYYIARGKVELAMVTVEGEAPIVSVAEPGAIVGEMGVFSTKKRNITLHCETTADVYAIDHETLSQSINNQSVMSRVLQKAHTLQAVLQQHTRKHHFEWVASIPFINAVGSKALHQKILDSCEGKVYPVHSTIISVSECCDRLVLFTRGKARISSTSVDLRIGEALGFTCLIPHRWEYHVVASETVESLELPYKTFRALLKQYNVYDEVKALTLGMIYPRVHPEEFQRGISMARHYVNPPCFPTSMEYDPKPFAARVGKNVHVASPHRPKRKEIHLLPSPTPQKLPPLSSGSVYTQEAHAFIEALDREMGAPGEEPEVDSEESEAEENPVDTKQRERAQTILRLTAGKDKKLSRTRNAEEIERLSKRIRALQRAQASSVPPRGLKGKTPKRPHSLPALEETTWLGTRTIAIQTEKSYLQSRAKRHSMKEDQDQDLSSSM